jgi:aryl-alcohol dehydrogenase-like predicted oxidoreductase
MSHHTRPVPVSPTPRDVPWAGRLGLGAMHLSEQGRPPAAVAIETIHAALDSGIRLIDTADAYCRNRAETGHNELLVRAAVDRWRGAQGEVVVATKGGHVRDAAGRWDVDGRPEHLVRAAEASRRRLGVDSIDLYQFHRPDPSVELDRSLRGLARIRADGVAKRIGLSNVDVDQLSRAVDQIDVFSVQNELSPLSLDSLPVLLKCHVMTMPFIAWGPFGGSHRAGALARQPVMRRFAAIAIERGASVHQLVLAWLLSLSPVVTVIPGTTRPASIASNVSATSMAIDPTVLQSLDRALMSGQASAVVRSLALLRKGPTDGDD